MRTIPVSLLFLPANPETGTIIKSGQTNRQAFCKCRKCGHHLRIATAQDTPAPGIIANTDPENFFKAQTCPDCKARAKPRLYLAGIFTGTEEDAHEEEMSERCIESFQRQWAENELFVRDGHVEQDVANYGISGPDQNTELKVLEAENGKIHLYAEWRLFDLEDVRKGVTTAQAELAKFIFCTVAGTGFKKTRQRRGLSIQGQLNRENIERKDGKTIIHDIELHCVSSVPNPAYRASELTSITKSIQQAAKDNGVSVDEFLSLQDPRGFPAVDPADEVPAEIIKSSAEDIQKGMNEAIAIEEADRLFNQGWDIAWDAWHDLNRALEDSPGEHAAKLTAFLNNWEEMGQKLHSLYATYGFPNEREAAMAAEAVDTGEEIKPPGPGETESASSIKATGGQDMQKLLQEMAAFAKQKLKKTEEKELSPEEVGLIDAMVDQFFEQIGGQKEQFKEQLRALVLGNAEPEAPPPEEMPEEMENACGTKPEDEEENAAKAITALKKVGYQVIAPKSPANALSDQIAKGFASLESKFEAKLKKLEESIEGNRGFLNEFIGGTDYAAQLIAEEEKALAKAAIPATPASTITLDASAIEALKGLYNPAAPPVPERKNGVTHQMLGKAFADVGLIGGAE